MRKMMNKYKKQCIVTGIIAVILLIVVYLRALFLPGLWHQDAFLYRIDEKTFKGSDMFATYNMHIKPAEYGADIEFSVNDKTKHYRIEYNDVEYESDVEIFEDGNSVFKGKTFGNADGWMLLDGDFLSADGIVVRTSNYYPTEEELFPGYTKLFNWAVTDKTDTRGEAYMLILILLGGVILFLDIKFPMLFWLLEHGLEVDGGEPSDWYLMGQKAGRVIIVIGILICMIMTFTIR